MTLVDRTDKTYTFTLDDTILDWQVPLPPYSCQSTTALKKEMTFSLKLNGYSS